VTDEHPEEAAPIYSAALTSVLILLMLSKLGT
jgi:hypothetical protein